MPRPRRLSVVRDSGPETTLARDARAFDWQLGSEEKSVETRRNYADSIRLFERFAIEHHLPTDTTAISRPDLEYWMDDLRTRGLASSTRHLRFAALSAFFSFCVREGILDASPMAKMRAPVVRQSPPPILSHDEAKTLLKIVAGTDLKARRDAAIVLLLLDTGIRRREIGNLTVADWMHNQQAFAVTRKGGARDIVFYGERAAAALERYWRLRKQHRYADEQAFWLSSWGPMGPEAIATLIRGLGVRAGIPHLGVHRFRHTVADDHLRRGGQEGDLIRRMGWRDRSMLDRYARSTQTERARMNLMKMGTLGDRL